ncbi:MAG: DUF721 domain-containing protein [bacterium]|jgi:predicted nucleic acid-binding Zn ribbon protein|nr:DUF721 domain-containing protein [bacterium]
MAAKGKAPALPGWIPGPPRPELAPGAWKARVARPVEEVLSRLGLPGLAEDRLLARIDAMWEELVGKEIAALAQVEELQAGELRIKVIHPVWRTELGTLAEEIRHRLNGRLAEDGATQGEAVRRLRFV